MSRSRRLVTWSMAVLLCVALAAILAAGITCAAVAHQRPQSALPTVPALEETDAPRPLFRSELNEREHHRPEAVPTPQPTLTPVYQVPGTVRIQVRKQDQDVMALNLARDIRAGGGYLISYDDQSYESMIQIDAVVPAQYVDRAEPLMRRQDSQINAQYEEWTQVIAQQPATPRDARDQPVAMSFQIKGKFFDSTARENLVALGWGAGTVIAILSGFALVMLLPWGSPE